MNTPLAQASLSGRTPNTPSAAGTKLTLATLSYKYVDTGSVPKKLICQFGCLEPLVDPRRFPCKAKHTGCQNCVAKYVALFKVPDVSTSGTDSSGNARGIQCAVCRETAIVPDDVFALPTFEVDLLEMLDDIAVFCPTQGCDWKGPRGNVETHIRIGCEHQPCTWESAGCIWTGLLAVRDAHTQHCDYASVLCPNSAAGCDWMGMRKDVTAHIDGAGANPNAAAAEDGTNGAHGKTRVQGVSVPVECVVARNARNAEANKKAAEAAQLAREREDMRRKQRLDALNGKIARMNPSATDEVCLDAGGRVFVTSRQTLCASPDSVLAYMFASQGGDDRSTLTLNRDETSGCVRLDCNPDVFAVILDYLRLGEVGDCAAVGVAMVRAQAVAFEMADLVARIDESAGYPRGAPKLRVCTQKQLNAMVTALAGCLQLPETNLRGLKLANTRLDGSTFEGSILAGACLVGASLCDVNFARADLRGADLTQAIVRGADFSYALLEGCRLPHDLTECIFRGARMRAIDLSACKLVSSTCTVKKGHYDQPKHYSRGFGGASYQGKLGTSAIMHRADLQKAKLPRDIAGVDFTGADLTEVDFRSIVMSNPNTQVAADLTDTCLRRCKFDGTHSLVYVPMEGAVRD